MNAQIKEVMEAIESGKTETPIDTVTHLGLLVERASMDRYGDPIYKQLGIPADWLELQLAQDEVDAILRSLVVLLNGNPKLAPTAAWAIGKSFSDSVVPHLIAALDKYWQTNDDATYQILLALDNHGKERAAELIRVIANNGHGKSQELARELGTRISKD